MLQVLDQIKTIDEGHPAHVGLDLKERIFSKYSTLDGSA
jgi:hypothetical protein